MPNEQISAHILGREYRLSCAPDEKTDLLAAVAYVDRKMQEVRDSGKVMSNDRIAVLAALNIAHELLTAGRPPVVRDASESELAFIEFKRRIQAINAALDSALAPQEKLF